MSITTRPGMHCIAGSEHTFLVIACVVESVVRQHEDPKSYPKCAVFQVSGDTKRCFGLSVQ